MASYGAQQNGSFSSTTLNQISTAVANGLKLSQRSTPVNTGEKRRQDYLSGIQKEATLARALTTEAGLRGTLLRHLLVMTSSKLSEFGGSPYIG